MKDKILELIACSKNKHISYADFIREALYDKHEGYYMKKMEKVGRTGDFITTSNIGNVYGQLIARWFYKLVSEGIIPAAFCELGSGTGRFAKAFLDEWSSLTSKPVEYYILETSPYHKQLVQQSIKGNVTFIDQLANLQDYQGMIFSNELFDALPVHVIEKKDGTLFEVMITSEDKELKEELVPLTNRKIKSFIKDYLRNIHDSQRIEVPLEMNNFIGELSNVIKTGIVVTVDYGYTEDEMLEPTRIQGSLRGYMKHQMVTNVLNNIGEMDITSHVQWDPYIKIGKDHGLTLTNFLRQDQFFLEIGILDMLRNHYDPNPFSEQSKQNRAIRSLITPGGMSNHFQVVIQTKGLTNGTSI